MPMPINRREFIRSAAISVPVASAISSGLLDAAEDAPSRVVEPYASLTRPLKVDLDGQWLFQEDPNQIGESDRWFEGGKIRARTGQVPLPWQLAFEDLRHYSGAAWYERSFTLPA